MGRSKARRVSVSPDTEEIDHEIGIGKTNDRVATQACPRREGLRPRLPVHDVVEESEDDENMETGVVSGGKCGSCAKEANAKQSTDGGCESVPRTLRRGNRCHGRRAPKKTTQSPGRGPRRSASLAYKKPPPVKSDYSSDDSLLIDDREMVLNRPWVGSFASHRAEVGAFGDGWGCQGGTWNQGIPTGAEQTAGPTTNVGADIQPVRVDSSVKLDQIGGLSHILNSLKEMVFFPLMYPLFFKKFDINPPKGVLFCGPPGTGKTLVARALAASVSKSGVEVKFYMRKGADVLSKWVGEAERQLKLLFEEAQRNQPSIIFFDEIDGLAPVRSSKQEQVHNSIVSTLLALMDGLDSRGQVVIIGATNRVDAIDGALRRPGRFDREFTFPLPNLDARAEIIDIHTRKWQNHPAESLRNELAESCVGYCGADLKALCTEAAITAFRKKYPQIYRSDETLVVDMDSVLVGKQDFREAMMTITPASHRGALVYGRPLGSTVAPCLEGQLNQIMDELSTVFSVYCAKSSRSPGGSGDDDFDSSFGVQFGSCTPSVYRPRFLLCGDDGGGLEHLGPAVLHKLERFPVHCLAFQSLLSNPGARSSEESLIQLFAEARRNSPSVLYLPELQLWWDTAHDQLRAILRLLLSDLPSDMPVLLFGTCSSPMQDLDPYAAGIFGGHTFHIRPPSIEERSAFISRLIEEVISSSKCKAGQEVDNLPQLAKAPRAERVPTDAELRQRSESEQHALRRTRMCFRDVCNRLFNESRFSMFHYPVIEENAPDYYTVVRNPMDVSTLLQGVDNGKYITPKSFLQDVELIPANAKEYNNNDPQGALIVSKACALRDTVHMLVGQMDPGLVAFCESIEARGGPTKLPQSGSDHMPDSTSNPVCASPTASAVIRGGAHAKRVRFSVGSVSEDPAEWKSPGVNLGSQPMNASNNPNLGLPNPDAASPTELDPCDTVEDKREDAAEQLNQETREQTMNTSNVARKSKVRKYKKRIGKIRSRLCDTTDGFGVAQLEKVYASVFRGLRDADAKDTRWCLSYLELLANGLEP